MQVRKAIIPCAGFGTRFLPVTKVLPKELLPIVDTPALCYIVDEAVKSGIEEIMIVISPQKESIKRLFEPNAALNEHLLSQSEKEAYALANEKVGAKISFCVQKTMNGNANAIKLCKDFVDGEPFAVLFGDDVMYVEDDKRPVTKQLIDAYYATRRVAKRARISRKIRACAVDIRGNRPHSVHERRGVSDGLDKHSCKTKNGVRIRVRGAPIRYRQQGRLSRSHRRICAPRRKSQRRIFGVYQKKSVKQAIRTPVLRYLVAKRARSEA